ncbi:hypothetical protein DL96DRAFT_1581135 [Flagelloscypha sp. PMI_526]|nr:hypothetical protein DL96DRAFT_1581135 [Flagelloscypha sp. PMI_526]
MSLPLDLLPHILGYLDGADLDKCCRVTVAFRLTARLLLFSHVILCSTTWEATCGFLLGATGEKLLSHINKVTMRIDGSPGLAKDDFEPLVQSFLRTVGPQLDAFCIRTNTEREWNKLHISFREDIRHKILPHIHTLELLGIVQIPFLTILPRCPNLTVLRVGSTEYIIGKREINIKMEDLMKLDFPHVASLTMDVFALEDFGRSTSLARYLVFRGNEIQNLTLDRFCDPDFPLALDFLIPFEGLRNSLLHLSFGTHLYETVIQGYAVDLDWLGLDMFPCVQTITFTAPVDASPNGWNQWWTYIALSFDRPAAIECVRSLKTMRVVVQSRDPPNEKRLTMINRLRSKVDFEIHIVGSGTRVAQNFPEIANAFRSCLQSWDRTEKLKFWVTD